MANSPHESISFKLVPRDCLAESKVVSLIVSSSLIVIEVARWSAGVDGRRCRGVCVLLWRLLAKDYLSENSASTCIS